MNRDHSQLGANVTAAGVDYHIWAPQAAEVAVQILAADGRPVRERVLVPAGDGFFQGADAQGAAGDRYKFRLNGGDPLPDPTSRFQPEGVHGPSMVINPETYQWRDDAWRRPAFRDLVIYELHVGAFTAEGTYRSAIEKLEHLRELGVNAIELMPLGDFPGGRNWGYDGVFLFAPSRAYGRPDDLRALVDAAHQAGIAVLLDVVYNHFGPDGNYLHAYIGEYLDEAKKTPWGGAIRYAHPDFQPLRQLVVSNPAYWMREFHIDGFRLDATHAIIDDSPRHILRELTASIHARGGFAIAEDDRNEAKLITPEADGGFGFDAAWADDFHHGIRVASSGESEGYLGDFSGTVTEVVDTLKHGWFYRGQLAQSIQRQRGTPSAHLPPERFVHCISNHDQTGNHAFGERLSHRILPTARRAVEALLCLSPYTPMLFMGQEWDATTPFIFFTDHNEELGKLIVEGRRNEFRHFAAFNEPAEREKIPNPQKLASFEASKLIWAERHRDGHALAFELYRACLSLRAREAAFRPEVRESWRAEALSIGVAALRLESASGPWIVLFDLHGGHRGSLRTETLFQAGDKAWEVVLSSNEARFGGDGTCAFDPSGMEADFKIPETIVLQTAAR